MRCRLQNLLLSLALMLILLLVLLFIEDANDSSEDLRGVDAFVDRSLLERVTRDPRRRIVYNYPISNNYTLRRIHIDVSRGLHPDLAELDRHMPVVTGFRQSEAFLGLGMVASVQSHMPLKKIIIYSMGVHPKILKQMHSMCNVEVRSLNLTKYPRLISKPENRAWRVYALMEVLEEYGAFFYASPHVRFRAPINLLLPFMKDQQGVIGKPSNVSLVSVTHPATFRALDVDRDRFAAEFPDAEAISEHVLVAMNNSRLHAALWAPLRACASEWNCIAPRGATPEWLNGSSADDDDGSSHTHRYDLSVVNILMYRHFGANWTADGALARTLDRMVDSAKVGGLHDYMWAHYCNPPKVEIDCSLPKSKC